MQYVRTATIATACFMGISMAQLYVIGDRLDKLSIAISTHVGHTAEAAGIAIRTSDYTSELLNFLLNKESGEKPAITDRLFNSLHDEPGLYHTDSGWHMYRNPPQRAQAARKMKVYQFDQMTVKIDRDELAYCDGKPLAVTERTKAATVYQGCGLTFIAYKKHPEKMAVMRDGQFVKYATQK